MKVRFLSILRLYLALSDLLLLNLCLFLGYYISNKYFIHTHNNIYLKVLAPCNIIWLLSTGLFRLYSEYTIYKLKDIFRATWRSIFLHLILLSLYISVVNSHIPIAFTTSFYIVLIASFLVSRFAYIAFEGIFKFDFEKRSANVLAISSMGGHWIELLRLMPLFKEHDVTFISNKANLSKSVEGYKFYTVPDANKDHKFNMIKCLFAVLVFVLILRPRVIITTGAAPGLLGILFGRILGIKTIWIDSIANVEKLSLSGQIATKIADRVYTQWEHLSTSKIIFNGNVLSV